MLYVDYGGIGMCIFKKLEIQDIKHTQVLKEHDIKELRKKVTILIIDDNRPDVIDILKTHKFDVEYKADITSINDVAAYDIILCDIRGVGKEFKSNKEGAYLIKEIKINYPSKIVITYTASTYDPTYNEYINLADDIIMKGVESDEWVKTIDDQIQKSINPIVQWEKVREKLLDEDVRISLVCKLEDQYVKAINSRNFESLKKLCEKVDYNEDIKKILSTLLTSLLVRLIKGGIS